MNHPRQIELLTLVALLLAFLVLPFSPASAAGRDPAQLDDGQTFADLAQRVQRPAGLPSKSAVCFSSRVKHPSHASDPLDTFKTAAEFHATGLYWVYAADKQWIGEVIKRGYAFQGTLHPPLFDTVGGKTRQQGRILNEKGDPVALSWQAKQKMFMGCANSPDFVKNFFAHARHYLDAGAVLLHMDDQDLNCGAVRHGGCFCPHCKAKAARAGTIPTSPEFQEQCTLDFYRGMFQRIDAYAGRHVPFSCNNYAGRLDAVSEMFDFGIAELPESHLSIDGINSILRRMEQAGKGQVFTFVSRNPQVIRKGIAAAYAVGGQVIVPWDVHMGSDEPRYFASAAEYADLYGFVRANTRLLDGYEIAAVSLPGKPDPGYQHAPFRVSGNENVSVIARALPGQRDAPVVLHCVDVGKQPLPFTLSFDATRLFGGSPASIALLTPPAYDPAVHEKAERTKDYSVLSVQRNLAQGYVAAVEVPALTPWGLIVVTPQSPAAKGVWPPYLVPDEASLALDTLTVSACCASKDAVIRYTLDGSDPSNASRVYAAPIKLNRTTVVKARAYAGIVASEVTAETFTKSDAASSFKPADIPGLSLWLAAEDLAKSQGDGTNVARWPARIGPAMVSQAKTLPDKRAATTPVLAHNAINGQPVVQFNRSTDLLFIEGFANAHFKGAFTLFLVTRSANDAFGATGNGANGGGGVPRLYFMRTAFTYNHRYGNTISLSTLAGETAITSYQHNGKDTVTTCVNGRLSGTASGTDYVVPEAFGSGGSLAIPYWLGNKPATGDVAEILAFDRELDDAERAVVEQYLCRRYRPSCARAWRLAMIPSASAGGSRGGR